MDKIIIRNLRLQTIIGVYPEERTRKQDVVINLTIFCDHSRAALSDDLNDAIDYKSLTDRVCEAVEASSFMLIEKLAGHVAGICLEHPAVEKVDVTIDKPDAIRHADSVAVGIERRRT